MKTDMKNAEDWSIAGYSRENNHILLAAQRTGCNISGMPEACNISIIITSYNLADFVGRAIESALNQDPGAHEVIVVDNGSTDNTQEVLAPFRDRIHTVRVEENHGVSRGRNAGALAATGNWFLFLDADDQLLPSAVGDLSAAAQNDPAGVVFGKVERFEEATGERMERSGERCAGPPPHPAKCNIRGSIITTPGAAIVRRTLHDEIGGYEKLWQPTEDRDYWLKCGVTAPFTFCDTVVIRKYRRMESMVRAYSDKAIFWGMRVQIEFLDWCTARGIDASFLDFTPEQMATEALQTALRRKDWPTSKLVADYAREHALRVPAGMLLSSRLMHAYYTFRQWTLRARDQQSAKLG